MRTSKIDPFSGSGSLDRWPNNDKQTRLALDGVDGALDVRHDVLDRTSLFYTNGSIQWRYNMPEHLAAAHPEYASPLIGLAPVRRTGRPSQKTAVAENGTGPPVRQAHLQGRATDGSRPSTGDGRF
ncbi:hypothetical protein FB451DRAFT_1411288 [Mycena latifolia]|nr:hypothetical protein FB451DRAFT_1411288 [Mycena latifolia]